MATTTKFIFTLPDGTEQKYIVSRDGTYSIGSAGDNDIALADPGIAAHFAKLVADETNDTRWFIQELEGGSIRILDDRSQEQIGHTHLSVSITEEAEPAPAPAPEGASPNTDPESGGQPDKRDQLDALRQAQHRRDLISAAIMITVCGILAFIAGVAWRFIQAP